MSDNLEKRKDILPPGTKKVSIKEGLSIMIKSFQGQIGIVTADINALYNSQMTDIVHMLLDSEIQMVQLAKKVTTLTKERDSLLKKLQVFQSAKVVKPAIVIKNKARPKKTKR